MTRLELAFAEIKKLPPTVQNEFAAWILEELRSEERWTKHFAATSGAFSHLADEALLDYKAGKTKNLDPDTL
jgi:hypothetical protein